MKKIIMAIIASLLVASAAVAEGSKTLEVGMVYGTISSVSAKNDKNYSTNHGFGLHVGVYNDVATVIGVQTNLFFFFPKTLEFVTGNTRINGNTLDQYTPFAFSGDLMLMVNIPLGFLDIRGGAGIGYTFRENSDRGSTLYNNFFSIPVSADVILHLGNVLGLKAGCDVQFVFYSWKVDGPDQTEIKDLNTYVFLPHISVCLSF